jgi:tRNA A-37 threonylcarbamoyl transferase component Bud32
MRSETGYTLYCLTGPKSGTVVNLGTGSLGIGRGRVGESEEWLHVPDEQLNRHHADLEWLPKKSAFLFRNRSKTERARINKKLVIGELELPETTHLALGASQFILHKKCRVDKGIPVKLERDREFSVQLLPGGFSEHLRKNKENKVGLNLSLHWSPRWASFVATGEENSKLRISRADGAERVLFPFKKPVALEVGDILVADFCRYEFNYAATNMVSSANLHQFRNPKGLIPGYVRLNKIGQGASSEVYLMLEPEGRKVAVKFLRPHLQRDPEAREQFEREGQTALSFTHECLLDVIHVGTNDAQEKFMVSEYMSEGSLQDVLEENQSLEFPEVRDVSLDVASGLAYLHRKRVVHRDVKPSNIFRNGSRTVLGDFGIVKGVEVEQSEVAGYTRGTPGYMAPEHFRGSTGPHSDQYALGVVLVELLTGQRMFGDDDPMKLAHLSAEERLKPLESLPGDLPENAAEAIQKMLKSDPDDRFADVLTAVHRFAS